MKTIKTIIDKRKFVFNPKRDGWIPHQYEETKQYDSFFGFNPNWTAADVGAWMGIWTIWAAPHVKKIYALEPVPELFRLLCRNAKLNGFINIELIQAALFYKTGRASMDVTCKPAASSLVPMAWRHGAEWLYEGGREISVQTYTWDDWVKRFEIEEINLLKMDVEGAELDILSGMTTVLPERISIAVYHVESPFTKIFKVLGKKGYALDGFGYYDEESPNKGKPHSGFFRRKDIPFETPQTYTMQEYELPTKEEMERGTPFYWGQHK